MKQVGCGKLIAAVVLIFGLCWNSGFAADEPAPAQPQNTQEKTGDTPVISFEETSHDFGEVSQGQHLTHIFKFKNNGKATLNIEKVKAG